MASGLQLSNEPQRQLREGIPTLLLLGVYASVSSSLYYVAVECMVHDYRTMDVGRLSRGSVGV